MCHSRPDGRSDGKYTHLHLCCICANLKTYKLVTFCDIMGCSEARIVVDDLTIDFIYHLRMPQMITTVRVTTAQKVGVHH